MENDSQIKVDSSNTLRVYSKNAIWGFSVFFSSIFGAVLLMQNFKDIGKRETAYIILSLAVAYTLVTIYLVSLQDGTNSFIPLTLNLLGGGMLSEYSKKHFPKEEFFEYKSIRKPLFISGLIMLPFLLLILFGL